MTAFSPEAPLQFRVLLFAGLRDALQADFLDITLPVENTSDLTVADLLQECKSQFPVLSAWLPHIRIAVNLEYSQIETRLHAGDEIAFIPPVAGG